MSFIQPKLIELLWAKRVLVLKKLVSYSQQLKSRPFIILWWVLNSDRGTQRRDTLSSLENFWVALIFLSLMDHETNERKACFQHCFLEISFFANLCFRWRFKRNDKQLPAFSVMLKTSICSASWKGSASLLWGTKESGRVPVSGLWLWLRETWTDE